MSSAAFRDLNNAPGDACTDVEKFFNPVYSVIVKSARNRCYQAY